jgi:hypothetical protein
VTAQVWVSENHARDKGGPFRHRLKGLGCKGRDCAALFGREEKQSSLALAGWD